MFQIFLAIFILEDEDGQKMVATYRVNNNSILWPFSGMKMAKYD
jgi:hypothetical protein